MIIYGPQFFIYGPPVLFMNMNNTEGPYNEKLRTQNNYNAQIKQRYYYYKSLLEGVDVYFLVFFALLTPKPDCSSPCHQALNLETREG